MSCFCSIYSVLDFAEIPEIPLQAPSCLLASGLTMPLRRAWFPGSLGLPCNTQGATNWRQQLQAVGMAAVGLSLKSYPALISHCTRRAVSEPIACSCHHLSQQAFEDVPPPTPCERSQNRTKCGIPMESFEHLIRV